MFNKPLTVEPQEDVTQETSPPDPSLSVAQGRAELQETIRENKPLNQLRNEEVREILADETITLYDDLQERLATQPPVGDEPLEFKAEENSIQVSVENPDIEQSAQSIDIKEILDSETLEEILGSTNISEEYEALSKKIQNAIQKQRTGTSQSEAPESEIQNDVSPAPESVVEQGLDVVRQLGTVSGDSISFSFAGGLTEDSPTLDTQISYYPSDGTIEVEVSRFTPEDSTWDSLATHSGIVEKDEVFSAKTTDAQAIEDVLEYLSSKVNR